MRVWHLLARRQSWFVVFCFLVARLSAILCPCSRRKGSRPKRTSGGYELDASPSARCRSTDDTIVSAPLKRDSTTHSAGWLLRIKNKPKNSFLNRATVWYWKLASLFGTADDHDIWFCPLANVILSNYSSIDSYIFTQSRYIDCFIETTIILKTGCFL